MTKKEKEQKIMEAFDLKVGDKIKACYVIYEIIEGEECHILHPINPDLHDVLSLTHVLMNYDWEKVEANKKCEDFDECDGCPLIDWMCGDLLHEDLSDKTIGEVFDKIENKLVESKKRIYGV